jgi:NADH dehydrogenase FAD-containing subunit
MKHQPRPEHVVIAGGGCAGVGCARKLASRKEVRVTLIDKNNYHQFQPLLYQVATSLLAPDVIVGGGPTGTEMAGALAEMINSTMAVEYQDLAVSGPQALDRSDAARIDWGEDEDDDEDSETRQEEKS